MLNGLNKTTVKSLLALSLFLSVFCHYSRAAKRFAKVLAFFAWISVGGVGNEEEENKQSMPF